MNDSPKDYRNPTRVPTEKHRSSLVICVLETTMAYENERIQRNHGETVAEFAERVKQAIIHQHRRLP